NATKRPVTLRVDTIRIPDGGVDMETGYRPDDQSVTIAIAYLHDPVEGTFHGCNHPRHEGRRNTRCLFESYAENLGFAFPVVVSKGTVDHRLQEFRRDGADREFAPRLDVDQRVLENVHARPHADQNFCGVIADESIAAERR